MMGKCGRAVSTALLSAAVCTLTSPAMAQSTDSVSPAEVAELRAQIQELRAEMAQMRETRDESWMERQRAEDVREIVQDVLAEAEGHTDLENGPIYAGYDDGFFLRSADGAFTLEIGGRIQFRYYVDYLEGREDESEQGFQVRRAEIGFEGTVITPRLGYALAIEIDRATDNAEFKEVIISYDLTDHLTIAAGEFTLPFLREEIVSSKRQLAVDRSIVTEFFTLDDAEQVALTYEGRTFRVAGSVNDGSDSEITDFGADEVVFSTTGRVDVKLAGEWDQAEDFVAWQGEPTGLFLGAATHYQLGDAANGNAIVNQADYFTWTADVLYESNGFSAMGAVTGGYIMFDNAGPHDDRSMYGALVQAGYNINDHLQPFVRYGWLEPDNGDAGQIQAVTAGMNYYFFGHALKFTTDVVYIFEGDSVINNPFGNDPFGTGLGLSGYGASDEDLVVLRTQLQLLF